MPETSSQFPSTHHSAIRGLAHADTTLRQRSWNTVIGVYWKPAYKHVRLKWRIESEASRDIVQSFFLQAMDRQFLVNFDPSRARFRTFFRTCLDRFVMNEQQASSRIKRGGDVEHVSLDFAAAEQELVNLHSVPEDSIDRFFEQEWARSVLTTAVSHFHEYCTTHEKTLHFQLFEAYDLSEGEPHTMPSYASLAATFGISESAVTNYLAWSRRQFRQTVLETIADLTASEEEYRAEVRAILGITLP